MKMETVRYTATLPMVYVDELKKMAKAKKIPSVNFAINQALDDYIKSCKAEKYQELMRQAGRDKAFLARTASCADDFEVVDSEVPGQW